MMATVEFDHEARLQAGKIDNIGTNRHLSPEVTAVDGNGLQGAPESLLRLGGMRAKLLCSFTSEAVDVRHDWSSVVVPPHPDLRSTLPHACRVFPTCATGRGYRKHPISVGRVTVRQSFRTAFTSASVGMN